MFRSANIRRALSYNIGIQHPCRTPRRQIIHSTGCSSWLVLCGLFVWYKASLQCGEEMRILIFPWQNLLPYKAIMANAAMRFQGRFWIARITGSTMRTPPTDDRPVMPPQRLPRHRASREHYRRKNCHRHHNPHHRISARLPHSKEIWMRIVGISTNQTRPPCSKGLGRPDG